ncbi:MAG TPA: hypothetical protein VJI96_04310 [Candidatus Andersenbacteria bacterium]|nr:hypothetical protein [Candidatus Andersenbacteria bacterium]
MLLHTKLAFEIWTGIVLLIIVIGGAAGFVLMKNDVTDLVQTKANNPSSDSAFSKSALYSASLDISGAISGGTNQ